METSIPEKTAEPKSIEEKAKESRQIQHAVNQLSEAGLKYDDLDITGQRRLIHTIKDNLQNDGVVVGNDEKYIARVIDLERTRKTRRRKEDELDLASVPLLTQHLGAFASLTESSAAYTPLAEPSTASQGQAVDSYDPYTTRKETRQFGKAVDELTELGVKFADLPSVQAAELVQTVKSNLQKDHVVLKQDKHYVYRIKSLENTRMRVKKRKENKLVAASATPIEPSIASVLFTQPLVAPTPSAPRISSLPYDPIRNL